MPENNQTPILDGVFLYTQKSEREWFYFYPEAVRGQAKGTMATGWLDIGEDRYYLNKNGAMLTGKQTIDGKTYEFEADGRLKK